MTSNMNIEELKDCIEKMPKYHQIEILRIFVNAGEASVNENKNGTFINLTDVSEVTINLVDKYVKYVKEQVQELNDTENEKVHLQETFFKEDKEKR